MLIILIIILILIIFLHYFCNKTKLIENLDDDSQTNNEEYQHYTDLEKDEKGGPLFLAFKNAANISSLHSEISELNNLKTKITDISGQTHANSKALLKLSEQIGKLVHINPGTSIERSTSIPKGTGIN